MNGPTTRPSESHAGKEGEARIPITRPAVPNLERVIERLRPSYERGMLTNGPLVRELERELASRLDTRHIVAVSSCTAGLMLSLRALELHGDAVLPSFTFSATAHAAVWAGLGLRWVECQPDSFQIDPADCARRVDGAAVMIATHIFGAPGPIDELSAIATRAGVPLVFDAAHAMGSTHHGRAVGGFGDVEVFSMSPTKTVVAGEGGIVATNRDDVAEGVRIGRDYGNPGNYDTQLIGLNARLSELHAAMALESLADLDTNLARRRAIARRYANALGSVSGITPQVINPEDESSYKDFAVSVDVKAYGLTRDELAGALLSAGFDTRPYFSPPVHRHSAYVGRRSVGGHEVAGPHVDLPATDLASSRALSLPMFSGLGDADIDLIVATVAGLARRPSPSTG